MIERRAAGPGLLQDVEIVAGARIALGLGQEVAVALLLLYGVAALLNEVSKAPDKSGAEVITPALR